MPDVDVVIATRGDRGPLLAEAIDGVLAQDYGGRVLVTVVYDTETAPREPVDRRDSPTRQVRWVWNDGPHGLAQARNLGVAHGGAGLVAFLDDDDLWRPTKLSRQIELLEQAPWVPLVGTGITILDAHGRSVDRPGPTDVISHRALLRSRVAELHPSTFVMRRRSFESSGGIDEQLPGAYAEDYDLVLRLSIEADLAMVTDCLTVVRWTGGSYFFSRWETIARGLEYLLAKHPDLASDRRGSARVLGQIAFARAAIGHRREAWRVLGRAFRNHPLEPRVPLAVLATLGVPAGRIQSALHRLGRGV